ncbi:MAG TPA: type VI secretion system baseplate subunit TssF [Pyrinomonadaceae bacterium]|nr:type VI secretion system baseplate subunit TssF [Pyrinomonadaceae bacterium]
MSDREELLQFYRDELSYLRQMGREFKKQYAKLASRLEISDNECADPHVERLIQSFAFLTARLQRNLRDEFPEITTALLGTLHPQLINPIPAMAIAQFKSDQKTTTGNLVPRFTRLFYDTPEKLTCRFRTCYPVTVWPLKVSAAGLRDPGQIPFLSTETNVAAVLLLELECTQGSFKELELEHLRFFLNGDAIAVNTLYEWLFSHISKIALLPEGTKKPVYLPLDSIKQVGFGVEDEVLPYPSNAHPAYRLLQEYFSFPAKYHFFDLHNLQQHGSTKKLQIFFLFDQIPARNPAINTKTFSLGCTPVINLFDKTTEPIRLDHKSFEYPLVADKRREATTEIHSILSVSAYPDPYKASEKSAEKFEPFYSYNHYMDGSKHRAFWHATRRNSNRKEVPGTEMFLSFLDLNFRPTDPPVQTVYAHTLCTNRELTMTMMEDAPLQLEEKLLEYDIALIGRPSLPQSPQLGGPTTWRLISHLSLNHLSLSEGSDSLHALREILGLYCISDRPSALNQIAGITQMSIARKSMYIGEDAWQGFCRGTGITLTFDEDLYRGSGAFLLGAVLNSFFGLYTAVNSFTQLTIKKLSQPERIWKQWEPRAGDGALTSATSTGNWKTWNPMAGEKIIL